MPEPNRIGVIHPSAAVHDAWFEASGLAGNAVCPIITMADIDAMRSNNWRIWNVLCLPGWEQLPDAQAIRTAAEALVVPLPRRDRAPRMVDITAPMTATIAPVGITTAGPPSTLDRVLERNGLDPAPAEPQVPLERISRAECADYLIAHFPHAFAPRAIETASDDDLIVLRGLSIRAEAASLNYRNIEERFFRARITELIAGLNEQARGVPVAPLGGYIHTTNAASIPYVEPAVITRSRRQSPPPPVADVLADAMTRAREAIERDNNTRRAREILDRVHEINAARNRPHPSSYRTDEDDL